MSKELRDFLYVFEFEKIYDSFELGHMLREKMPDIEKKLSDLGIYILDWNFDSELKYLFIMARCYGERKENAGMILEDALCNSLKNIAIKRKKGVLETKRMILDERRKLLALVMLNLIKKYNKELVEYLMEHEIDVSWLSKCRKPQLALSLLLLCYLSEDFSKDFSELYLFHYPIFLNEYDIKDITNCLDTLISEELLLEKEESIALSSNSTKIIEYTYRFLENKCSEASKVLPPIFQSFKDINSSLEKIVKHDGTFEDFRLEKIIASTIRCGIKEEVVFNILNDLIIAFKLIGNLSRKDVVEAVKFSLDKIDGSREYSSKFEFYINTLNHIVLIDEKGMLKPFTVSFIKKMIKKEIFERIGFKVSERMIDSIASKVFEDIRFIYSSVSPLIPLVSERKVLAEVKMDFLKKIIEKEVELQLPYYYRILKSSNPSNEAENIIKSLASESKMLFDKILKERKISIMVSLFNRGAYYLIASLMILIKLAPSTSHISNCTILRTSVRKLKKNSFEANNIFGRSFLNKINAFITASLKIYYFSSIIEAKTPEKTINYLKSHARLGLKICNSLISMWTV